MIALKGPRESSNPNNRQINYYNLLSPETYDPTHINYNYRKIYRHLKITKDSEEPKSVSLLWFNMFFSMLLLHQILPYDLDRMPIHQSLPSPNSVTCQFEWESNWYSKKWNRFVNLKKSLFSIELFILNWYFTLLLRNTNKYVCVCVFVLQLPSILLVGLFITLLRKTFSRWQANLVVLLIIK